MSNYDGLKGKRLLVLGGAGVHCKVVEAAKEMGVYTIVTDYLVDSPAKILADESLMISILDVEAIVAYCKDNAIDGVINFCNDPAQKAHQEICEKLGFNSYGNADQVRALANKRTFKQKCKEAGVDTIPEYTLEDVENNNVDYPVVAKPVDSRGSRGVTICWNRNELLSSIPDVCKESSNGEVIIEKYMGDHQGFSAAYIVVNGVPYLSRTLDRYEGRAEDNLQRQCICARHPSKFTESYLDNVHKHIHSLLMNLGLVNAPVFMQGYIDGDTVRFYDAGLRFAGSEYERILKQSTGIDVVKAFICYSLGGDLLGLTKSLENAYLLNGKCGIQVFVDSYPGVIKQICGLDKLKEHPNIINIQQKLFVGDVVPDTGDVKRRVFEIIVVTNDCINDIHDTIKYIENNLDIIDVEGRSIITPLIEPEKLY